jgi:hypothetical protein
VKDHVKKDSCEGCNYNLIKNVPGSKIKNVAGSKKYI